MEMDLTDIARIVEKSKRGGVMECDDCKNTTYQISPVLDERVPFMLKIICTNCKKARLMAVDVETSAMVLEA